MTEAYAYDASRFRVCETFPDPMSAFCADQEYVTFLRGPHSVVLGFPNSDFAPLLLHSPTSVRGVDVPATGIEPVPGATMRRLNGDPARNPRPTF